MDNRESGALSSSEFVDVAVKPTWRIHIRVDEGTSYPQARRIYETHSTSGSTNTAYSGVINVSKDAKNAELRYIIKQLQEDAKLKHKRMEERER